MPQALPPGPSHPEDTYREISQNRCKRQNSCKRQDSCLHDFHQRPSKMDRDALMADTITGLLADSAELPGSMIIPGICCPQTFVRTAERFKLT